MFGGREGGGERREERWILWIERHGREVGILSIYSLEC
jgi:hypothetical protein